jgi:hypothetical protein
MVATLQFNPKTMALRKNRSPKWNSANCCQTHRFCLLTMVVGAAMVALALYADQELVRHLNETTQTQFIRKPVEYLSKIAIESDTADAVSSDFNSNFQLEENEKPLFDNTQEAEKILEMVEMTVQEGAENEESLEQVEAAATPGESVVEDDASSTMVSSTANDVATMDLTADADSVQEGQQEITNNEKAKPRLFLHVGPQKTGSSTLQSALDIMSELTYRLDDDNLTYRHITPEEGDFDCELGPWGGFINCVVSDKLKTFISETRNAGQDLLLTDENLGDRFVAPLRAAISDVEWDVTVIVVYRRIHEWLVSWYNQINKTTNLNSEGKILVDVNGIPYREEHKNWPDNGGVYVPEFTTWYRDYIKFWDSSELPNKHRSVEYFKLYDEVFKNVVVYNMHQGGDFLTGFFCDVLKATHSCQKLQEHEIDLSEVNASVNLDHDILATFFYDQNLVDKSLSRKEVVAAITNFIAQSGKAIPRSCDNDAIDQIFDWLVKSEKIMMEEKWSDDSEEYLKKLFDAFVAKGKLCDLDRDAVIQDEEWRAFFQTLGNASNIGNNGKDSLQTSMKRNLVIQINGLDRVLEEMGVILNAMDDEGHGLKADGYEHQQIDPFDGFFECENVENEDEACKATDKFSSLLSSTELDRNMYLILESIDGRLAHPLSTAIEGEKWNTKVVVSYVRLHKMLYGLYTNQYDRVAQDHSMGWPEEGGLVIPTFLSWYSEYTKDWNISSVGDHHLSIHLLKRYSSSFDNVSLSDPYKQGSLIENIICEVIPDANATCESFNKTNPVKEIHDDTKRQNAAAFIDADILAVAAWQDGLVKKELPRQTVVSSVRQKIASSDGKALPRICNADLSETLYEWVIESEKMALGSDWRPKRISGISADFHEFLKSGNLCDLDIAKALQDDSWVQFFDSLE